MELEIYVVEHTINKFQRPIMLSAKYFLLPTPPFPQLKSI